MKYTFQHIKDSGIILSPEWEEMFKFFDGKMYVTRHGYVRCKIAGLKEELLHRVISDCPKDGIVDHIDRNPKNNLPNNLRVVNQSTNMHNRKKNKNKWGFTGVCFTEGRWEASIIIEGKKMRKRFRFLEEAISQRREWDLECGSPTQDISLIDSFRWEQIGGTMRLLPCESGKSLHILCAEFKSLVREFYSLERSKVLETCKIESERLRKIRDKEISRLNREKAEYFKGLNKDLNAMGRGGVVRIPKNF